MSRLPALAGEGIQMALSFLAESQGLPWPRHVVGQYVRDGQEGEVVMVEDYGFPPDVFLELVKLTLLCERCTSYYVVAEAWRLRLGPGETAPADFGEDHPDREDILMCVAVDCSGALMEQATITRDGEAFSGLGEIETLSGPAVRGHLTRLLLPLPDEETLKRAQVMLDSLSGERGGPIHHIDPASGKRLVTC